jgi:hypothetical protein
MASPLTKEKNLDKHSILKPLFKNQKNESKYFQFVIDPNSDHPFRRDIIPALHNRTNTAKVL